MVAFVGGAITKVPFTQTIVMSTYATASDVMMEADTSIGDGSTQSETVTCASMARSKNHCI